MSWAARRHRRYPVVIATVQLEARLAGGAVVTVRAEMVTLSFFCAASGSRCRS